MLINLLAAPGGTGIQGAEIVYDLAPVPDVGRRILVIDADMSVRRVRFARRCDIGVSARDAARLLLDAGAAGYAGPEVLRIIARDAALRAAFGRGTERGARTNGTLLLASNAAHGDRLLRVLLAFIGTFTREAAGAEVMLHCLASDHGGTGATVAGLIADLVALGLLPVAGLRLWLVPWALSGDGESDQPRSADNVLDDRIADLEDTYGGGARSGTDVDRRAAEQLANQAALRERLRTVCAASPAGLPYGISIASVAPLLDTPAQGGRTVTYSDAVAMYAASIAAAMASGELDLCESSKADDATLVATSVA